MERQRPLGFALLAGCLAWLALAALGNIALNSAPLIWASAYGVMAFISAIGLWRVAPWAYRAFLGWAAAVVLMMVGMETGAWRVPLFIFVPFLCFVIGLLFCGSLYIKRTLVRIADRQDDSDVGDPERHGTTSKK